MSHSIQHLFKIILQYTVLIALAVLCVFPFWWTLVVAVSTEGNIFEFPPSFMPQAVSMDNFIEVFRVIPMIAFYKNSLLITVATVCWKLLLCSLAAYPLSRMRFSGSKLVFGLILATMILPSEVNFLVNFITLTKISLVNTYTGVILPNVVTAVSILLLKQAFDEVPQDLIDAARVDGAPEWIIFWKIVLPLITPWLATVGILTAVEAWNDYIWPSIVISKPDDFPLSAGVLYLRGTYGSSTRVIAAGTILTIAPVLVAFLFTQRFFMRGMDGAVK
ncbi:carbohydrate ABC transporter permease [Undibacterium sp. RTI2.1]|uniref:carbohydrate ABC transporter permease n=1 Tax=unclassified Undibacterium TaxID=2630295 RepID=UPI002AB3B6D2|nr:MULTISPECIES: carbohydrate ABC transporter permease [unclassified Undibacterium]MDY7538547.1 carbohydrate ABC transporter permease [Undibacterium sp. 5I1]MEB0031908.1 carbohydrate ABC transporter permease [Undibacterium sp. RTI2.1]MEB0116372.1 carbohydrate ABC transporter permease [Undibacterium sp. RTI2.2]MEB0231853.1 carbohydrate ABC transporter permease [Undibacterium sp. 10I3]MEB0258969.1 carbohydrate ABC transporter permease [Undibacterium sp. 5I1]